MIRTVGFPRMHKEKNERRDFPPSLIGQIASEGLPVFLEEGYGSGLGFSPSDYIFGSNVGFVSNEECYRQDLVVVLRAPEVNQLRLMKPGSTLLSMLHYHSRPWLRSVLADAGINAVAMDAIVDDQGRRLVVDYEGTARAGISIAFDEMIRRRTEFFRSNRGPIVVTIMGIGNLGIQAGKACFSYGEAMIAQRMGEDRSAAVIVQYVEKSGTANKDVLRSLLCGSDILVDATRRDDFTRYIVENDDLAYLKEDAIILDLAADPYDPSVSPMLVKAIEGIPYGTLDKYVFEKDAPEFDQLPAGVKTHNRRVSISCNAWPGIFPRENVELYAQQLLPFIRLLLARGGSGLNECSADPYERAMARATLGYYLQVMARSAT